MFLLFVPELSKNRPREQKLKKKLFIDQAFLSPTGENVADPRTESTEANEVSSKVGGRSGPRSTVGRFYED